MKKSSNENPLWRFITSIKLAVFLLITLAITSIVGTLIPQGESLQSYLDHYGPTLFKVIRSLHLYDTYHSWWYISLLGFFTLNLISCTLKRLPFTLALYKKDNLNVDPDKLIRMPFKAKWKLNPNMDDGQKKAIVSAFSKSAGGITGEREVAGGRLYLSEKGKWSYWGLYGLHSSILIILIGAIIGLFYGFKGQIMLMEGSITDHATDPQTGKKIPLGFSLRCNSFNVSFYDTGAPKEYRSDLTVIDQGKEVFHKAIRVNSPMEYKGITIYQAYYQAVPRVTIKIVASNGKQKVFNLPTFQKTTWPEAALSFGILQYLPNVHGVPAARIWIDNGSGPAQAVWVLKNRDQEVEMGSNLYRFSLLGAKERYMTGLQIKKDPGVWVVWLGCTALIIGFVIVFWVPHRRMWLWIGKNNGKDIVIISGQSNKNRIQFEQDFRRTERVLEQHIGERS